MDYLLKIAKWTKFLAIVATAEIGLMALAIIIISIAGIAEGGVYFLKEFFQFAIVFVIFIYPIKKAYSMATSLKNSVLNVDSLDLESGLDELRNILNYMGMLTIIVLLLYGMVLLFGFFGVVWTVLKSVL